MKKKLVIMSLSVLALLLAICGYIVYCYFTPIWDSTTVGFPISSPPNSIENNDYKPYTPADKYVQLLGTPIPVGKHRLPVPEKYLEQSRVMYLENKTIVDEIQTFIAPTYIAVDFMVVGKDTIATYHGKATTKDGETIEYSRDIIFRGIIVDFVSGYGDIPSE